MIEHYAPQGSEAWKKARAGCITGSMFATARQRLKSGPSKGDYTTAANVAAGSVTVKDTKGVWSWSASANYKLPFGLIPYGTISKQSVIITGQGAEVDPTNVKNDSWITSSKLYEAGIKGELMDGKVNTSLAVFRYDHKNRAVTDYDGGMVCPDGYCSRASGKVRSQGLEAEVSGEVARGLQLSYAEYVGDDPARDPIEPGDVGDRIEERDVPLAEVAPGVVW